MTTRFKLTEPQLMFYKDKSRIKSFIGGRGTGKSYMLAVDLLAYAATHNNSIIMVVGLTANAVRNVNIKLFIDLSPDGLIENYNRATSEISLINGSTILFRSANNTRDIDNLRGLSVHSIYLDEVCTMSPYIWDVCLPMVREGPDEHQHIKMFSTPRMNWFHAKFKAKTPKNSFMLDEINSKSNTNLSSGFLQSLDDEFGGTNWYEQEVAGKWTQQSGLVYNLIVMKKEELPGAFHEIRYSIDFGFTAQCAILTYGRKFGKWYMINEVYETGMTDEDVSNQLHVLYGEYGNGSVVCDSAQPQSIKYLRNHGINAMKANKGKDIGVRTMRNMIDSGKLIVSDRCLNTIIEGNQFIYAKEDKDDAFEGVRHCMDSCRYFCMSVGQKHKVNLTLR